MSPAQSVAMTHVQLLLKTPQTSFEKDYSSSLTLKVRFQYQACS